MTVLTESATNVTLDVVETAAELAAQLVPVVVVMPGLKRPATRPADGKRWLIEEPEDAAPGNLPVGRSGGGYLWRCGRRLPRCGGGCLLSSAGEEDKADACCNQCNGPAKGRHTVRVYVPLCWTALPSS